MKKFKLLCDKDLLSESLNISNTFNNGSSECCKKEVAARGLAIITSTKVGQAFTKDRFKKTVKKIKEKVPVKPSKPAPKTSDELIKLNKKSFSNSFTDLIIPKKNSKDNNLTEAASSNLESSNLCSLSDFKSVISASNSENVFKTPKIIAENFKSLASPILTSSPIIPMKNNGKSNEVDFLAVDILGSFGNNPLNYDSSKLLSRIDMPSPIPNQRKQSINSPSKLSMNHISEKSTVNNQSQIASATASSNDINDINVSEVLSEYSKCMKQKMEEKINDVNHKLPTRKRKSSINDNNESSAPDKVIKKSAVTEEKKKSNSTSLRKSQRISLASTHVVSHESNVYSQQTNESLKSITKSQKKSNHSAPNTKEHKKPPMKRSKEQETLDNRRLSQPPPRTGRKKEIIENRRSVPLTNSNPVVTRYGRVVRSFSETAAGKYIYEMYLRDY